MICLALAPFHFPVAVVFRFFRLLLSVAVTRGSSFVPHVPVLSQQSVTKLAWLDLLLTSNSIRYLLERVAWVDWWAFLIFYKILSNPKALAKRTRKSTQICKTRTCVRTCEGWPNGSQVAKSCKFHAYHWLVRFYNNRLLAINLCRLALGGQTVKNLRLIAPKFELDQSQRKWAAKRNASWMQVQNLRRLASPFGQGFSLRFT